MSIGQLPSLTILKKAAKTSLQYTDLQSQFRSSYSPFFPVNLCYETSKHSVQTADDNSKVISQLLQLILALYIFRLVLCFNSIISDQIKCYLADTVWYWKAYFSDSLSAMIACYWKSVYQKLKEVNAWNVTVWSIMVKCYCFKWLM